MPPARVCSCRCPTCRPTLSCAQTTLSLNHCNYFLLCWCSCSSCPKCIRSSRCGVAACTSNSSTDHYGTRRPCRHHYFLSRLHFHCYHRSCRCCRYHRGPCFIHKQGTPFSAGGHYLVFL